MNTVRVPRPAVLDAIPRSGHVVIEASAGTGKTYTIEHLVIDLLLTAGARIEELLVVTFTEKATEELRARVRGKIAEIAELTADQARPDEPAWVLDDAARDRLQRALRSFDLASIHTIHGFCQRILTEHAFQGQRLLDQELLDGRRLFSRVFRQELRTTLTRTPVDRKLLGWWLEQNSIEDLEHALDRIVRCRATFPRPENVEVFVQQVERTIAQLADAAWIEGLKARVDVPGVHGSTRKAMKEKLDSLHEIGVRAVASGDGGGFFQALDRAKKVLDYLEEKRDEEKCAAAAPVMAEMLDLLAPARRLRAVLLTRLRPALVRAVEEEKERAGGYDFDDMLRLVAKALDRDESHALVQQLRDQYRFALIDEFQDTDEVQWSIFDRIFRQSNQGHRLFLVGDPKQAIYGFRGADVHTYLEARDEIQRAGGAVLPLTTSYRATHDLIQAVNGLLDESANPPFFARDTIRYDHPVTCGRPERRLTHTDGSPAVPVVLLTLDSPGANKPERLARAIAAEIHALLHTQPLRLGDEEIEAEHIHVLARSAVECRRVGRHLRRLGVPFAFFQQENVFASDEALEIRDLLAAIGKPFDGAARARAWTTCFFSLPLGVVADCRQIPADHPLAARLIDWHELATRRRFEQLFPRILDESGVLRRERFQGRGERKITNYHHVFELLLEEALRRRLDLTGVIATLDAFVREEAKPPGQNTEQQRLEGESSAVQVMTMHKAKGLEAPVVFLFGGIGKRPGRDLVQEYHEMRDGRLVRVAAVGDFTEQEKAAADQDTGAEERRILYVALTRAMGRLVLPCIPPPDAGKVDGMYRHLNQRLLAWRTGSAAAPYVEERDADALASRVSTEHDPGEETPFDWDPPLDEVLPGNEPTDHDALRADHAAIVVSSYSRMKRAVRAVAEDALERGLERDEDHEPVVVLEGAPEREEPTVDAIEVEVTAEETRPIETGAAGQAVEPVRPDAPDSAAVLPGGPVVGTFLHEVLEHMDLAGARDRAFEVWRADPAVRALFDQRMLHHDIEARHRAAAEQMVFHALTARVELGAHALDHGFASLDARRVVREMEFLFPIPDAVGPVFAPPPAAGFTVQRGYLRGFVDMVFEHQGEIYFVDWKSDLLADYAPDALAAHVAEHYAIQVRVYVAALVRWLKIQDEAAYEARFGGLVYCFLRGVTAPGDGRRGILFQRPTWAEARDYGQFLRTFRNYA